MVDCHSLEIQNLLFKESWSDKVQGITDCVFSGFAFWQDAA